MTTFRRSSVCVDHISLRHSFLANNYYYSSCHMYLVSTVTNSAPFLTSIESSHVGRKYGVAVDADI